MWIHRTERGEDGWVLSVGQLSAVIGRTPGGVGVVAGEPYQPSTLLHGEDDVNPILNPI